MHVSRPQNTVRFSVIQADVMVCFAILKDAKRDLRIVVPAVCVAAYWPPLHPVKNVHRPIPRGSVAFELERRSVESSGKHGIAKTQSARNAAVNRSRRNKVIALNRKRFFKSLFG